MKGHDTDLEIDGWIQFLCNAVKTVNSQQAKDIFRESYQNVFSVTSWLMPPTPTTMKTEPKTIYRN